MCTRFSLFTIETVQASKPTPRKSIYDDDDSDGDDDDSDDSSATNDSGFKSTEAQLHHAHHKALPVSQERGLEYITTDVSPSRSLAASSTTKTSRPKSARPKSARPKSARPKSGLQRSGEQQKCLQCEDHLLKIERQESDISVLTQTLETHERAFESIQISIDQILHPSSDLGQADTTNRDLLLRDIDKTIRGLKSDISKSSPDSRAAREERQRLQDMVTTLVKDKALLESQKSSLEQNWQESKKAHTRDIEQHKRDIESIRGDMQDMARAHAQQLNAIVDEHRRELSDNRQQFNHMMSVVMQKFGVNDAMTSQDVHSLPRSRGHSRGVSRGPPGRGLPNEEIRESDEDGAQYDDDAATSLDSRATSRTARIVSRNISPDLDSISVGGATTASTSPIFGQHSDESLIAVRSQPTTNRRRMKSGRKTLETMRVSPDGDETALPPVPTSRVNSHLGRYVEEHTKMTLGRERDKSLSSLSAQAQREHSFTTISELTRKSGRKTMQS